MYIVEVIPLTLLPPNVPQILSYFFDPVKGNPPKTEADRAFQASRRSNGTESPLPKGAIVEVNINKRKSKAVVVCSSPLEKQKLSLKKVGFQIKKINKVLFEKPQVSDRQLKIAVWMAKRYYAPLGYTLKTILPPFAFRKKFPLPTSSRLTSHESATSQSRILDSQSESGQVGNPQLWIYRTKKLVKYLEPIIKEVVGKSFDKAPLNLSSRRRQGRQVLIVVPEKSSINYFFEHFSKKYKTSVIFSGLSNEKLYETWIKSQSGELDVIIGTRQALNMPFKDLGLIIVDDPLHEFYKSDMMPRYNAVTLVHKVAELNNAKLVLTSVIPGVENYYKAKNDIYELKNIEVHIEVKPQYEVVIVDMAQEIKNGNWSPISKKLNEELISTLKDDKRVLIFSPRRGYAGILICSNCGSAVKCSRCEVAMRTHRSVEMILVCHHCGISKSLPENCSVCGNHNLKTAGPAGTQKIYDYVRARLANENIKCPVLALDTDIVKNETEENEIILEISKPGPSVLIATQMVFSHRFYLNFDLIAIINADALTNVPDFRSEESLFYQMKKLVNFSPEKMIVQTYNPENKLVEKAIQGNYVDFYDNELKSRQALNYPPFFKLVKLTFRHANRDKASYAARVTTEKLKMAVARMRLGNEIKIIEATPAYIEKERGLYFYNIFLKVREGYQGVNDLLKYADPGWIVDVEPRSLL